ncbi:MAG: signal recognition particle protein [Acidobacteria bacterium]|nr:signal recognition particle protein [Acidobacteriota bacterium]
MFDQLSKRLQKIIKDLKGEGRLTEGHIEMAMREIRMALLEADVHFKLVRDFVERVKSRALGQQVLQSLTPGQQVAKIVRDELVEMLGGSSQELQFSSTPPSVLLMAGLQGSGKTTTVGKLGKWLSQNGRRPLLVSVDVYRPAALEQLDVIGKQAQLPVFRDPTTADSIELARRALTYARNIGHDVLIVDTAGRLHMDEELMQELEELRRELRPVETLLVADAMTGQDAVKSAGEFHRRLGLTGVILTKLDGDARGGAALSIKVVTGTPIKFVGLGEKLEELERFHPQRMAGRILGMGDVLSLIEKAEEAVEEEEALRLAEKIQRDAFTLEDFRDQLRQIKKLGSVEQILGMLPSIGPLKNMEKLRVDEKQLVYLEAIINSMTPRERRNPRIINGSRRKRIAQGSGRTVQEVNRLLKQFDQTRKMIKSLKSTFSGKQMGGLRFP